MEIKNDWIHVVVGLIFNDQNEILVAEREQHKFQGGRFEFPGGKVEKDEEPIAALTRELEEEIGIQVITANAWKQFHHEYADRKIFLDVFRVTAFKGKAHGKEGQKICWVALRDLSTLSIPDANQDIVKLLVAN